jgi:hypothetical protein
MSLPIVLLIGAVLGPLYGAGIFFEPEEPYKVANSLCGDIEGGFTALLTGFENDTCGIRKIMAAMPL